MTVLWLVLQARDPAYRPPRSWVLGLFAAYLAVALLSATLGISFTHSWWSDYFRMLGVWDLLHWFLFIVVCVSTVRGLQAWESFLNWNLGVALVLSALALVQPYDIPFLPGPHFACRADATLGNPSYLAAGLVVTSLMATGLLVRSMMQPVDAEPVAVTSRRAAGRRRVSRVAGTGEPRNLLLWRGFWAATALLGIWVIFQTGTRGALLGLLAGAVAMPLLLGIWGDRKALRPVALAAAAILLVVGSFVAIDQTAGFPVSPECREQAASGRLGRLLETGLEEGTLAIRLRAWEAGIEAFMDRPLLGWGPENFEYAYELHVDPSIYRYSLDSSDKAHNVLIEELTTKGIVGLAVYVALGVALVLAVVRRRRPARDEAFAYAMLGALTGYFIQNLFLFDMPTILLQASLLVAWIVAQEPEGAARQAAGRVGWLSGLLRRARRPADVAVSSASRWIATAPGTASVVAALALSLYFFTYLPYAAARTFDDAVRGTYPLQQRLALASSSFETFPGMADLPRRLLFGQLTTQWDRFSPEGKAIALAMVLDESEAALSRDSGDARLLAEAAFTVHRAAENFPAVAERMEPLVSAVRELAPRRLYTYELMIGQRMLQGDYASALGLIEEFEGIAPWAARYLSGLRQLAEQALAAD